MSRLIWGSAELDIAELESRAADMRKRAQVGPAIRVVDPLGLPKSLEDKAREEAERKVRIERHKLHNLRLAEACEQFVMELRKHRDRLQ